MISNSRNHSCTLIASLGSEPQVVTATLDLLLERGESIKRLVVIHTGVPGTPVAAAVDILRQAFSAPESSLKLELIPIVDSQQHLLSDVNTPEAAQAAFRAFYQQLRLAKMSQEKVHLSVAGGRKTMALYGMLAAQLLFDDDDQLWYLYSTGDFLKEKRLHPQPGDQTHLVPIPVVRWARISPTLLDIGRFEDPYQALQHQEGLRLAERLEEARSFVLGALTPAEARVVGLLVREGLSDADIAARLNVSPRTINDHLRAAYHKAAAHWDLADVDRTQLISLMYFYFLDSP